MRSSFSEKRLLPKLLFRTREKIQMDNYKENHVDVLNIYMLQYNEYRQ